LALVAVIPATLVLATPATAIAAAGSTGGHGGPVPHVVRLNAPQRGHYVSTSVLRLLQAPGRPGAVVHSYESSNWSGLALTGTGIQGASGQWTVPAVTRSTTPEYSASWVGVDGFGNDDLIQTGTEQDSDGLYSAWWEILPAYSVTILAPDGANESVRPGDKMWGSVLQISAKQWSIFLDDTTQKWQFKQSVRYAGPGTSAEWIEEAPTVGAQQSAPPNFGTVHFSGTLLYSNVGNRLGWHTTTMNSTNEITMVTSGGAVRATPSAPSAASANGQSFSDTYVTAPGIPTSLKATAAVKSVHLSWTMPASNGGTPIAGYYVRQYLSGVLQKTLYVTGTSTTITGLAARGSYSFAAASHSSDNYSSGYSAQTARVLPAA
jgi:hypothetical protein